MIGFLKKVYPEIEVILGGGLVTSWTRRTAIAQRFHGLVDRFIDGQGRPRSLHSTGLRPEKESITPPLMKPSRRLPISCPGPSSRIAHRADVLAKMRLLSRTL